MNEDDRNRWDTYISARPTHSQEFYEKIFSYHSGKESSSQDVAVNVGAGPGQVSEVLVQHFKHVIVSDLNKARVQGARERLKKLAESGKASFLISKGEAIHEHLPAASVDLAVAAQCITLMDPVVSLLSFHQILKPDVTMAIWLYGRPQFLAANGSGEWDAAYNFAYVGLVDMVYAEFFQPIMNQDPYVKKAEKRAQAMMRSQLQNVEVPRVCWKNVSRTYWNCDCESFADFRAGRGEDAERACCKVCELEMAEEIRDRDFWAEEGEIAEVKQFTIESLPAVDPTMFRQDKYVRLLQELEGAMGGCDGKRKVTWPVVLIMATKR